MLLRLTNADLSNENFRFTRSKEIEVAGVLCLAIRVSFTGDPGWELHCAAGDQVKLHTALPDAAGDFGGGPVFSPDGRAVGRVGGMLHAGRLRIGLGSKYNSAWSLHGLYIPGHGGRGRLARSLERVALDHRRRLT